MWGKRPTSATEALSQVDVDHTGTITLDELKLYFDKVGIPHDNLAKTFKVLDVDKESWMGHQNGGTLQSGEWWRFWDTFCLGCLVEWCFRMTEAFMMNVVGVTN